MPKRERKPVVPYVRPLPPIPDPDARLDEYAQLGQRASDIVAWCFAAKTDGTQLRRLVARLPDLKPIAARQHAIEMMAQRRARLLLRTLLTASQLRMLDQSRYFQVTVPSGRTYRFRPNTGAVQQVEWHRSRYFLRWMYCLHDYADGNPYMDQLGIRRDMRLPHADLTIAQMLLLLADEDEFLARANATEFRNMAWDGEWHRRTRAARAERSAAARLALAEYQMQTADMREELPVPDYMAVA